MKCVVSGSVHSRFDRSAFEVDSECHRLNLYLAGMTPCFPMLVHRFVSPCAIGFSKGRFRSRFWRVFTTDGMGPKESKSPRSSASGAGANRISKRLNSSPPANTSRPPCNPPTSSPLLPRTTLGRAIEPRDAGTESLRRLLKYSVMLRGTCWMGWRDARRE